MSYPFSSLSSNVGLNPAGDNHASRQNASHTRIPQAPVSSTVPYASARVPTNPIPGPGGGYAGNLDLGGAYELSMFGLYGSSNSPQFGSHNHNLGIGGNMPQHGALSAYDNSQNDMSNYANLQDRGYPGQYDSQAAQQHPSRATNHQQANVNQQIDAGHYGGRSQQSYAGEQGQVERHPTHTTQQGNVNKYIQAGHYDDRTHQSNLVDQQDYRQQSSSQQGYPQADSNNQQPLYDNEGRGGEGEGEEEAQDYDQQGSAFGGTNFDPFPMGPAPAIPGNFPPEVQQQLNKLSEGTKEPEVPLSRLRFTGKRPRADSSSSPAPSTTIFMGVGKQTHEAAEDDEDNATYKSPPGIDLVMGPQWKTRLDMYIKAVLQLKQKHNKIISDRVAQGQQHALKVLMHNRKAEVFALTRFLIDELQFAIPATLLFAGNAALDTEFLKELMDNYNRSEHICRIIAAAFDIQLDWKKFFHIPSPGAEGESDFEWERLSITYPVVHEFYLCILAPSVEAACDFYVAQRNSSASLLGTYYLKRNLMRNVHYFWPIPGPTMRAIFSLGRSGTYLAAVNKKTVLAAQAADFLDGEQAYDYVNGDTALAMLKDMEEKGKASEFGMHHLRHGLLLLTVTSVINDAGRVSRWALRTFLDGKNPFIPKAEDFTPVVAVAGALTSMAFLDVKAEIQRTGQAQEDAAAPSETASTGYPLKQGAMSAYVSYLQRDEASSDERSDINWLNTYCYTRAREAYLFASPNFPLEDFAAVAWTPAAHVLSRDHRILAGRQSFLSFFHRNGDEEAKRRGLLPDFVVDKNTKVCDFLVANNHGSIEASRDSAFVPTSIANTARYMRQARFISAYAQIVQQSASSSSASTAPAASSSSSSTLIWSAMRREPSSSNAATSSSTSADPRARKRTRFSEVANESDAA